MCVRSSQALRESGGPDRLLRVMFAFFFLRIGEDGLEGKWSSSQFSSINSPPYEVDIPTITLHFLRSSILGEVLPMVLPYAFLAADMCLLCAKFGGYESELVVADL